ncbi:TonB-dependent receptor [Novosphingobium sp. M1R2S20]|uniref:TonB-dependent receptor n=1 Tax=Novosphingobium rhizovicinum TaxID=3228928 RepID=A0ABV3R717_9SPHN
MSNVRHSLGLAVSLFALAAPAGAAAQETGRGVGASSQDAAALDAIVVTARRREESLLDVPVAVSAISAQALADAHVTDVTQIAQMTPQVLIAPASGGGGGTISIRGVGSSYLDPGIEQSVGVLVDNVSVGRGRFILASQFDLQQVEILKGPQALFFGKNSPAGVISITSASPTRDLQGMVRAGYEFEAEEKYVEAFISGPLNEQLGFRVAGKFSDINGWLKNVASGGANPIYPFPIPGPSTGDAPAYKSYSGRVTLRWEPSSDFDATFKFSGSHLSGNGDDYIEGFCAPPALALGQLSTTNLATGQQVFDPNSDCRLDQVRAQGALPPEVLNNWPGARDGRSYNKLTTYIGSLALNYRIEDVTLTSVSGYTKLKGRNLGFYDLTSFASVASYLVEDTRTWSQELRVSTDYDGPINLTAGGFFEDAKRYNTFQPILGFVGFDPANGNSAYTYENRWDNSGRTIAAFAQLRWSVLENLELAGGARYTNEKKKIAGGNLYSNLLGQAFGLLPVGQTIRESLSFSNWSPEITLTYKPADNLMTYVAYKTGFKSGGLSTPATISAIYGADPSLLAFNPEKSKGFEAGIKGETRDRRLRFDLVAYRYTFDDLQLTSFEPRLIAYFIKNAGRSRTSGVETSVAAQLTPELGVHASGSYNKAKYLSFPNAQCYLKIVGTPACTNGFYDRSGQPLPRAPKWTFNFGGDYEKTIGSSLKAGLNAEAVYTGKFFTDEQGAPDGFVDDFWRLNASARLADIDDRWELALIGRNLTNEYYQLVSNDKTFATPGEYGGFTLRPREVVVQGTFRF